ncbi:MAG: twin-arginine translocation pathway signal protein [Bacteroidota bacterium]
MDHDDTPIGRLLTRREALALVGASGAALFLGCGTGTAEGATPAASGAASPCLVKPEATEGPFFATGDLFRSDLRTDVATGEATPGMPLALTVGVSRVDGNACTPLQGAIVDIWHCDARGAYSGFASEGTEGSTVCRGYQRTNADGEASFVTVYPGWYRGRAVHLHLKVRTDETADAYEFTSQLYFPDALSETVFATAPYDRPGAWLRNERDGIYTRGRGAELLLTPEASGEGYAARFDFGLDLSDTATGAPDGFGRRG